MQKPREITTLDQYSRRDLREMGVQDALDVVDVVCEQIVKNDVPHGAKKLSLISSEVDSLGQCHEKRRIREFEHEFEVIGT